MSGRLQAVVEQGLNLPPQLPVLVVHGGNVDEELVLQQHVDVASLQTAPAALRLACGLVELWRQVVQHGALVSSPWLHLDGEADEITGETCDLNLGEEEERRNVQIQRQIHIYLQKVSFWLQSKMFFDIITILESQLTIDLYLYSGMVKLNEAESMLFN